MFKGSLAGLALVFVPLAVIAIEFRMLTVPVVVVVLELFIIRCRCVYWGQRFSSYAILIISLQLSVAPLFSSALIAVLTSGKLVYVKSLAMTLAPIVSTVVFIVFYSRKSVVQPLFTIYGDRVLMRTVTPSRSQWWWLAGLARILAKACLAGIQLVPAEVISNGQAWLGYYVVNILNIDKAFDMDGCVCCPLLKSMPEGPKKFERISLLSSSPKHDIFLAEEDRASVIVSDALAQRLDTAQLKGVALFEGPGSM